MDLECNCITHFSFWKQAAVTLGRRQKMNEPQVTVISHAAFSNTDTTLHTTLTGQPTAQLVHARTKYAKFLLAPTPDILWLQQDGIIYTCSKFLLNSNLKK